MAAPENTDVPHFTHFLLAAPSRAARAVGRESRVARFSSHAAGVAPLSNMAY
jgi:hypothetical protein